MESDKERKEAVGVEPGEDFLKAVGLTVMHGEERAAFLDFAQSELETIVGEEIAKGLSKTQLAELAQLKDPTEIKAWLEKNKPDYKEIVAGVMRWLKEMIRRNREQISGSGHSGSE